MQNQLHDIDTRDHCRIGSLENIRQRCKIIIFDHCRIGSLEIGTVFCGLTDGDHCRIGSLENMTQIYQEELDRSLPHRQLRKYKTALGIVFLGSLPHRQLIKVTE